MITLSPAQVFLQKNLQGAVHLVPLQPTSLCSRFFQPPEGVWFCPKPLLRTHAWWWNSLGPELCLFSLGSAAWLWSVPIVYLMPPHACLSSSRSDHLLAGPALRLMTWGCPLWNWILLSLSPLTCIWSFCAELYVLESSHSDRQHDLLGSAWGCF